MHVCCTCTYETTIDTTYPHTQEGPGRTIDLNEPNPFAGDEPEQIASVGYRWAEY